MGKAGVYLPGGKRVGDVLSMDCWQLQVVELKT